MTGLLNTVSPGLILAIGLCAAFLGMIMCFMTILQARKAADAARNAAVEAHAAAVTLERLNKDSERLLGLQRTQADALREEIAHVREALRGSPHAPARRDPPQAAAAPPASTYTSSDVTHDARRVPPPIAHHAPPAAPVAAHAPQARPAARLDVAATRVGSVAPTAKAAPTPADDIRPSRRPIATVSDGQDGETCSPDGADDQEATESTVMFGRAAPPAAPKDFFHGMSMLRIRRGADEGKEFKLPFDRSTLGRAPTNRVTIAEDLSSRVHAEIRYENNRFVLRDNGSTNGTHLNDSVVVEHALSLGDIIRIGGTELIFTCEGYDLKDEDPGRSIAAFEKMLDRQPDFIAALQNLAFLLERNAARRREAEAIWTRLKKLES